MAEENTISNHPYRSLDIPSHAPLQLRPSPRKGWGAFATRDIAPGTPILEDSPLFVIQKPDHMITESEIRRVVHNLEPHALHKFSLLRDNGGEEFKYMSLTFAQNSFHISTDGPVQGVFPLLSRFSHSCAPNAHIQGSTSDFLTIFATKDIARGEEITFSYRPHFEATTRYDRNRALCFECNCRVCAGSAACRELSDLRRRLIRGLFYLIDGADLNGNTQDTASCIIVDPELKLAAEESRLFVSVELILRLLVVALLEDEGLLNEDMLRRNQSGISVTAGLLKTESNVEIVRSVLAESTWMKRFGVALVRLYGKIDAADFGGVWGLH